MESNIDVKALKKISLNYRVAASRLLKTNFEDGMANLKRFLLFIDNQPIIKKFIDDNFFEFDVEKEVRECETSYNLLYSIPTEPLNELSFVYQILKYYSENYNNYLDPIPEAYSRDRSLQKHVDEFNKRVVMPFVNLINTFLEELYIEGGDAALSNPITINNQSGQVNLAQHNSNITATQNLNTEAAKILEKFIAALQVEKFDNKDELKEMLESVLADFRQNSTPDKTTISTLINKINNIIALGELSVGAIETGKKLLKFFNGMF